MFGFCGGVLIGFLGSNWRSRFLWTDCRQISACCFLAWQNLVGVRREKKSFTDSAVLQRGVWGWRWTGQDGRIGLLWCPHVICSHRLFCSSSALWCLCLGINNFSSVHLRLPCLRSSAADCKHNGVHCFWLQCNAAHHYTNSGNGGWSSVFRVSLHSVPNSCLPNESFLFWF